MKRLKINKNRKQKAQGLVEFALALPIFLLAVFGVIELSRFFLVYSSVYTVSREATRYGSAIEKNTESIPIPHYLDCAGIRQAGMNVGLFGGVTADQIDIRYESNPSPNPNFDSLTRTCEAYNTLYQSNPDRFFDIQSGDRIVIRTRTTYQPILGVIPAIPIETINGRTIMLNLDIQGISPGRPVPPTPFTPVPSPTSNVDPQVHIIDDDAPDDDLLILRDYTSGIKAINADVTDFNPDNRIHTWSLEDGDEAFVDIQSLHTEDTSVNFTSYGLYTFQLEVFDGQYTGSDTIQVLANARPEVSAGGPYELVGTDGTVCSTGNRFRLDGTATDAFGNASDPAVLTYSWSRPVGTTFDPFAGNTLDPLVTFSSPGIYNFTLSANDGYVISTSDPVSVPVNYPPVVIAEVDDDVPDYPDYQVTLSGSATDPDGLPEPDEITAYLWEKVSGPGNVSFADVTSPTTTATFTARGTYRIRLKANDGCEYGYSEPVTIHVNELPVVNANTITNQPVLIIPGSALTATISGSVRDDGYPNDPVRLTHEWTGPDNIGFADSTALSTTISFESPSFTMPGPRVLRLTAYDGWESAYDEVAIVNNTPPVAEAGPDQIIASTASAVLNGSATDINLPYQSLTYFWERAEGTGTGVGQVNISNPNIRNPTVSFTQSGEYVLQLTVSDGLDSHSDRVTITKNIAPHAVLSADPLMIPSNGTVYLDGKESYDQDNFPNSPLSYWWVKHSGPGRVTFTDFGPTDDDPSASFDSPGNYVLRLWVYDGLEFDYSDVFIQVNAPPTASAGAQQLLLSTRLSTTLNGSASDDGLPTGSLSYTWRLVSGPDPVSFSSTSVLNPTVSLGGYGEYVFELTVNDGWEQDTDTVIVRKNALPTVDAGDDQTLVDDVYHTINGSGSDNYYPIPLTLTYLWTIVIQPNNSTVTFENGIDTVPTPSVRFSSAGIYVLRLEVSDGEETVSDEVTITITNN